MPHSRIPVRPHVLLAFCLGLGVLGMAVLGLLLAPAQHARAAQTTLDNVTQTAAQGAPSLDALRRHAREYARQHRPNAPSLAAPSFSPDQGNGQITGRLVAGDTGVPNIPLELRAYRPSDGLGDHLVLTTTTTITGGFVFANPPALPANYAYYVEFINETDNQNLAYFWDSRDIETYTAGQQATVGTLDVANVPLVAPADNATVTFPVTFQWTRRARTTDKYALYREDLSGDWVTSQLFGYVDRVTLTGWQGLRASEPYFWGVWIDNVADNGSFGISQRRTVTFADVQAEATGTATAQTTGTATLSAPPQASGTPTPTGTAATCLSGTVQVNIQNFEFVPSTVNVCQGATVRWTNLDTVPHTSTSDTGVWDSGTLSQNQSFSFTFNTLGTYPYHCTIHPNMHGVINVVAAAPAATVTPTATRTAGATGTATAMMTGTPTVEMTGTATAQPTAMMTSTTTPTVEAVPAATGTATAQPTAQATGTATAEATGTATASATGTATLSVPATTGTPTPTSTAGICLSGTVQVNIQNFAFVPANVTVCQGATVRWTNLDTVQHTSTSDTGVWDSGLLSQNESFSFTFNTVGIYPYHCTPHPNMRGIITVVAGPGATVTPTATGPAEATGTATAVMTGTATAQPTAVMTGTPTVETVPAATGTATAQATGTATAQATGTATVLPTSTATATATRQPTGTATIQPTGTATPRPTGTAVSCGGGNLCAGVVVVRAFIDFGCDGFFNRGTDYPLYGSTVTATLPDGTRLVSVVDENGNAVLSGINLGANDSIQVSIDSPPLPTWVQQASLGLAPCGSAPTTVTLQRSNFGLFGVAFTDFRFGLTQR